MSELLHTWPAEIKILADAYLAEHPADEDESVTIDWLESVGFTGDHGIWSVGEKPSLALDTVLLRWGVCDMSVTRLDQTIRDATRGWVRQLCKSLGIELKGQHARGIG